MSDAFDLLIVIPVYEDWSVLSRLLRQIDVEAALQGQRVGAILVNDSLTDSDEIRLQTDALNRFVHIEVLTLGRNLGHQRAITVGLSYIYRHYQAKNTLVMDADGEDRPEEIGELLAKSQNDPDRVIFAGRHKRSESPWFRGFYWIYKKTFKLLTGKPINFGNYCLIPASRLKSLMLTPEIWNHFSAGIIKSHIPYSVIPTERGERLDGRSRMGFSSLVMHGLSAISVFMEVVAVRLVLFSLALIVLTVVAAVSVVVIKYATNLALPGWSSTIMMGLGILFMQGLLISTLLTFVIFPLRSMRNFIPADDCAVYIAASDVIHKQA